MFKIYDGRDKFYQWDLDRKLIVEDATITEVHFCNRTDDCSLVCEVYEQDGLNLVNVPNVLLQTDWRINVYAYDSNYTKFSKQFDVVRRSKPADYVYTETEVKNYDDLAARVDQIEKNGVSDEQIASAVGAYLDENPVEVDLTGYATEQYVIEAIGEIPEPDLSDYATIKDVQDAIDNLDIPEADVDLSNYYTKSEVDDAIEAIELTPGPAGKDGYTPVKGVDYFDGAPGKDGEDYVLTEDDKAEIAGMVDVSGGEVAIDNASIQKKEDGTLFGALKFKYVDGQWSDDWTAWGGDNTTATGNGAFAFGHYAEANGYATAAFNVAKAYGSKSFATGYFSYARGEASAVFGERNEANGKDQVAMGRCNAPDTTSALIIGNGETEEARSNAMTVDFDGNLWVAGEITVGADKKKLITADDVDLTGYATETYVTDAINQALVGGDVDLSEYAKTADVATMINEALGVIENGTY